MAIVGRLNGLQITPPVGSGEARYELAIGSELLHLNDLLGQGLQFRLCPDPVCGHCDARVTQLMGGGYCRNCFFALARCDTCFVSPARCHFAAGSCREPDWGERVCMQPHLVYLANSSGLKVGLTQQGRQQQRWLSQGATQGLVIALADTRRDAGVLEALIAQSISDRTQWRRLVSQPPVNIQLQSTREQLQARLDLPQGCRWLADESELQLAYPVAAYAPPVQCLLGEKTPVLEDNLCGIKGQYLLLQNGVFNVAKHAGLTVAVDAMPPFTLATSTKRGQLPLF